MGRSARNMKVRKETFQRLPNKQQVRGGFKASYEITNVELSRVFGLQLEHSASEINLTCNLEDGSRAILHRLYSADCSNLNLTEAFSQRNPGISTSDIEQGGFLLILCAIFVTYENRITERDLIRMLGVLGFPQDEVTVIPIFHKTIFEMLADLTKREYICKIGQTSMPDLDGTIEYCLGNRSLQVFGPEELSHFLINIMGDRHDSRVLACVRNCFAEFQPSISESGETT